MCLAEDTLLLQHKEETANEVKVRVAVHCNTFMKQCVSKATDKAIMFSDVAHIMTTVLHTVTMDMKRLRKGSAVLSCLFVFGYADPS